jgi:uncharacterized membrane protein (UPF0127 family)
MSMRVLITALTTAVAIAAGGLLSSHDAAGAPASGLTLDGKAFKPELAITAAARSKGLMNRSKAPKDGMLFVFSRPTRAGFWMKNTHVPLVITFFDAAGRRLLRLSMKPCHVDPCEVYDPARPYRFALEMPVSDRRPAKRLGPVAELRRLIQRAS